MKIETLPTATLSHTRRILPWVCARRIRTLSTQFDNRHPCGTLLAMNASAPQISFAKLASVWPVTRQRLQQISKTYGRAALLNPDVLAARYLPDVFQAPAPSPLVDCLRDPAERLRIAAQLRQLQS